MRFTVLTGTALLGIGLAVAACNAPSRDAQPSTQSPQAMSSQPMASQPMTSPAMAGATRTGSFTGLNDKHVSGTVTIANGKVILSGFSSDKGPDLHIHLTKGSDQSAVSTGQELGAVASDTASQTFDLSGTDASMYDTVLINCDKAKEAFGAAALM
ncbi:DM13 domain-containing protein [Mycobacteroides salmoniphilum]|uniref:Electron transfer DM13 n=1 Tax=Mycobacteroides salmoniphilum TaxID=404941 RepID=A0A4R8SU15_9MYCO|nr:DM13 domain-containing protein [Mycobacteroides salmoniphilum]TDZ93356.1 Electron transfer DM13 [Mycobacteroides salmoniphilum]TEA03973.1 Electron transfer DM13 [Mycobacteroides salmoniphilum]